jgi:hypothetical protein
MNPKQLAAMYRKGYRYQLCPNSETFAPLCAKLPSDVTGIGVEYPNEVFTVYQITEFGGRSRMISWFRCQQPLDKRPALITPVVFRVWRENGDVLALFPTLPSDIPGKLCVSYAHIGQHGGADYALCILDTRPATPQESAPLTQELKGIGYQLRVYKRATQALHDTRQAHNARR